MSYRDPGIHACEAHVHAAMITALLSCGFIPVRLEEVGAIKRLSIKDRARYVVLHDRFLNNEKR